MKRTALIALMLFATAPAFAQDLCSVQLQKLDDASKMKTNQIGPGSSQAKQIAEFRKNAMAAHQAGDEKKCIAQANQALTMLRQPGESQ
ncbi:hypothetical protein [Pseudomonas sp. EpS/L25]|uniref:hypothetical protein n=1 Tax=Pseudomonas sp. EpS/L25 TaxID=1749078 RepID=UPI0007434AC7|nr:hypothetical protein [Pseudomonas sp. EpS/L25]KUM41549.1 hypothetical protein AR540_08490 [Pseudomonas sp. EpS/L25]